VIVTMPVAIGAAILPDRTHRAINTPCASATKVSAASATRIQVTLDRAGAAETVSSSGGNSRG
jgi:hypothetical protein